MRANRVSWWKVALYAVLTGVNALGLVVELARDDSTWWKIALRLLGVVIFGLALAEELRKVKVEPAGEQTG